MADVTLAAGVTASADYQALLRGVLLDPAADLPRLVLADWLDEHADKPHEIDRAEYIRLGCELATTPHRIVAGDSCPKCAGRGRWRSGQHFDHQKICFCVTDRDVIWEPGAEIDNPAWVELRVRERQLLATNETLWSKPWRTKATVDRLQKSVYSCCDRHADRHSCTCEADAPGFARSRGFVSEVRLTLAQFVGGPCPECGGSGRLGIHGRTHGDCPACDGTGRVTGCAETLFRTHPITRVVLSDRRPYGGYPRTTASGQQISTVPVWWWDVGITRPGQFGAVPRHIVGIDLDESEHPTRAAADDWLSARCVAYGRGLAGLPPIGGV